MEVLTNKVPPTVTSFGKLKFVSAKVVPEIFANSICAELDTAPPLNAVAGILPLLMILPGTRVLPDISFQS